MVLEEELECTGQKNHCSRAMDFQSQMAVIIFELQSYAVRHENGA